MFVLVTIPQGRLPSSATNSCSIADRITTRRRNAHGIAEYELLYPWHPWAGCLVHIHEVVEKAGREVFRCSLSGRAYRVAKTRILAPVRHDVIGDLCAFGRGRIADVLIRPPHSLQVVIAISGIICAEICRASARGEAGDGLSRLKIQLRLRSSGRQLHFRLTIRAARQRYDRH